MMTKIENTKRKLLLLLILLIFIGLSDIIYPGYKKNTESLLQRLPQSNDDQKIEILDSLIQNYIRFDLIMAEKFILQLKNYSDSIGNKSGKILAGIESARMDIEKSSLDSASDKALNCLKLALELKNNFLIGQCYSLIASINSFQGNFDKSFEAYFISLDIFVQLDNQEEIAKIYQSFATNYYKMNSLKEAMNYVLKAINICFKTKNYYLLCNTYNTLGSILFVQQKYDSSMFYYQKAIQLAIKYEDERSLNSLNSNISFIYYSEGKYEKALQNIQKELQYAQKVNIRGKVAYSHYILGFIYTSMKNYDKAIENLELSYHIYDSLKLPSDMRNTVEWLCEVYELKKDYKTSVKYYKKWLGLNDSLFSGNKLQKIKNLEMDMEIASIEKENELAVRRSNYIFIILLVCIGVFGVLSIIYLFKISGKKKYILLLKQKVDELTNSEIQLQKLNTENEKYKIIFDVSPSLLVIVDRAGNIVDANQKFYETFEYSKEEILKLKVSALRLKEESEKPKEDIAKLVPDQVREHEVINITKTGKIKIISLRETVFRLPNGTELIITGALDITEKRFQEEEREKSEKNLQAIVSSLDDLVIEIDENLEILNIWTSNETKLKTHINHLKGKSLEKLPYLKLEEFIRKEISKVFNEDSAVYFEQEIDLERKKHWLSFKINPIQYKFSEYKRATILVRDISEKKKSEQELVELNQELKAINDSKDKFFSIVAHDLKSPFQGLLGLSQILVSDYDEIPENMRKRYIFLINEAAKNTINLVENLLSWSRIQTGRMEFNPESLILSDELNNVFKHLDVVARKKEIILLSEIDPSIFVFADFNMLQTILRNLISNSLKFTHSKGKIWLSAEYYEGNYILINVSDNGVGMDKNQLNKLFKIGESISTEGTQKEGGTGLGLLLCKEMVERHNGKIWVTSEINKGTTFSFTIPKK